MSRKLFFAGLILLIAAAAAMAADGVTGKWVWEAQGFGGTTKTTLNVKAEGAKLTGTISVPSFGGGMPEPGTPPQMEDVQISNGKVDGNNISFELTRDMMGTSRTTKYEGVLAGGELKLKIIQAEVTAKKQ